MPEGKQTGVFLAQVVDLVDPEKRGRVKIQVRGIRGFREPLWAPLATLTAGDGRGSWFIPEVDDEVLVAFLGGNVKRPYVLGSLWSEDDGPPESMDLAGKNDVKSIRTRSGVRLVFDDSDGQESLTLETPAGQRVVLEDADGKIVIEDASGNSVVLEPTGVTVTSAANLTFNAATVEVNAGMVTVNSAMSKFSGVVQCDTLISNSVVSASYSPGAGNIW